MVILLMIQVKLKVQELLNTCENIVQDKIDNSIYSVNILLNTLDKLNPINLLRSGYAIINKQINKPGKIKPIYVNKSLVSDFFTSLILL